MAVGSTAGELVPLALRLGSVVPVDDLVALTGLPVDVVEAELAALSGAGHARCRDGRLTGWALTPAGRAEGERRLAAELDRTGTRGGVREGYRRFLVLNPALLAACTAWQVREVDGRAVPNDHTDAAHDAAAVAALGEVDAAVAPVLDDLAALLARFGGYRDRLTRARRHVEAGEGTWFTSPAVDSYHAVWFELHEHLLATLGIDRAAERDEQAP